MAGTFFQSCIGMALPPHQTVPHPMSHFIFSSSGRAVTSWLDLFLQARHQLLEILPAAKRVEIRLRSSAKRKLAHSTTDTRHQASVRNEILVCHVAV